MNSVKLIGYYFAIAFTCIYIFSITSCADDETGIFDGFVTFEGQHLMPIGDQVYKLWLYDRSDTSYTYVGDLSPDADGSVSSTQFMNIDQVALNAANALAVSIDNNTSLTHPQGPIIIAGDFSGQKTDTMTIAYSTAISDPLTTVSGEYDVLSPSTINQMDSVSGVWFYDTSRIDTALLGLPVVSENWEFEAWLDFGDGIVLSMGKFKDSNQADRSNIFSGSEPTLHYPGEDFINNLPPEISTPVDVRGKTVFVTIEPVQDFDVDNPFFIRPLSSIITEFIDSPNAMSRENLIRPSGKGSR